MFPLNTRFLVVDDSLTMRIVLVHSLKEMGYAKIVEGVDGLDAWRILESGEPIDAIIMDHNMPKCTGLELLEKLLHHPQFQKIPAIMITSDSEKAVVERASDLGAAGFISKPIMPDQFKAKLNGIFQRLQGGARPQG